MLQALPLNINELAIPLAQSEIIEQLVESWSNPFSGLSACMLIDGDNRVFAHNLRDKNGKWIHAEKRALKEFIEKFGYPSENAFFVSTLSPCTGESKTRIGEPCSTLIKQANISQVYCGYLSNTQRSSNNTDLNIVETQGDLFNIVCGNLYNLFALINKNTELAELKISKIDQVFSDPILLEIYKNISEKIKRKSDLIAPDLLEAYTTTRYQVDFENIVGAFEVKIGNISERLDKICKSKSVDSWAFVTPYNPYSEVLTEQENINRLRTLQRELTECGFELLSGRGVGEDPNWSPEKSVLILGINRFQATQLGRFWQQNAIVFGEVGEEAELVIC